MSTPIKVLCASALFVLIVTAAATQPSHASGLWYVATTGSDSNDCATPATPCASINEALNKPGFVDGDTILVAAGMYTGAGDEVVHIGRNVTLLGGWDAIFNAQYSKSTINGEGLRRGVAVEQNVIASIDRFAIRNGFTPSSGGGILNRGTLTLTHSLVSQNTSENNGGGIASYGGNVTIIESTIIDNQMGRPTTSGGAGGGGIYAWGHLVIDKSAVSNNMILGGYQGSGILLSSGVFTLTNTTVSGNRNSGTGFGEGITAVGSSTVGKLTLSNVTVSNNQGNGIYSDMSTTIQNSILANNGGSDCYNWGPITSLGFNIIRNDYNCAQVNTDIVGFDPKLGTLGDYGGSTPTLPLLPGSPAINAGNPAGCMGSSGPLVMDQRGLPRLDRCDIGAYEVSLDESMQAIGTFAPLSSISYEITLTNKSSYAINTAITDTLPTILSYQNNSLKATNGQYNAISNTIYWNGMVAANSSITVTFTALLSWNVPGCETISNRAFVSGNGFDSEVNAEGITRCVCDLSKSAINPVLSVGPTGSWDQALVYDPVILKDGALYKMWYSGSNGASTGIGYATSPDGINWTKYNNNPILLPSLPWEGTRVFGPMVIRGFGGYVMWYTASDGVTSRLGYALSEDGLSWTKSLTELPGFAPASAGSWDDASVSKPTIVQMGNVDRLWYTGNDGVTDRIGFARMYYASILRGEVLNPVVDLGAPGAWDWIDAYAPSVVPYGDKYLMWYSGSTLPAAYQTGFALSSDGITWSKQPGLIAQGPAGTFDSNSADYPAVILEGNQFKIWYSGLNSTGTYNIGYATAQVCSAAPAPAPGSNRAYLPLVSRSVPPAPTCAPYYSDNFSNANSGWYVSDNADRKYAYVNGEYQIWAKNPNEAWFGTAGAKAIDFAASVSARRASGTSGAYGLLFGINEDWSQFYEVLIDDNLYSVWRYNAGWTALQNWTSSNFISTGTNWNRLKVVRNGTLITVYINGQQVVNLNDGTFLGMRRIGLAAESNATAVDVRFDDFAMYPAECGAQVYRAAAGDTPFEMGQPESRAGLIPPRPARP